jgi:hypothetical protein
MRVFISAWIRNVLPETGSNDLPRKRDAFPEEFFILTSEEFSLKNRPGFQALFFCVCLAAYLWVMQAHRGSELADDGAFFLRYAMNMLSGYFWVWNPGEAPVWGASAPLFPLFLSGPLALGFDPVSTVITTGIVAGAVGLSVIALLLATRAGLVAGLVFLAFTAISSQLTYWVGSGLETPLTLLLLALALFSLLGTSRIWVLGLAAGLLMVHKLDMVPVGGLLLLAGWLKYRRFPAKAVVIATGLVVSWYLFAWWYFGSPVPNSFITKALHQSNLTPIIDWRWYGKFVLLGGIHKFMAIGLLGLWFVDKSLRPVLVVFAGLLVIHLTAYTIKHPIEPYAWYGMGALVSLSILASLGIQSASSAVARRWFKGWSGGACMMLPLAYVVAAVFLAYGNEQALTAGLKAWTETYERDRADAGRWVAKNTPADFVVQAGHGNPAFFSGRKVFDSSFLNRPFEAVNSLAKYRPEIVIAPSPSNDPYFKAANFQNYQIVKVFDRTASSGVDPSYWFAVLVRKDVLGRITDATQAVSLPVQLKQFVGKVSLGDQYGVLNQDDGHTFFVHPGASTATSFVFNAKAFAAQNGRKVLEIDARISPKVPADAIARGAAVVGLTLMSKDVRVGQGTVKSGQPFHFSVPVDEIPELMLVVDNLNGPDSDWLLISFN